jgi:hypothetical protein
MKTEMLEFLLHTQGFDINYLQMKAPSGEIVIDPKIRMNRHQAEIHRRFPNSQYNRGIQYTTGSGLYVYAVHSAPYLLPITVGVAGQSVAVTELAESETASNHPWWIAWILGTR